VCSDFEANVINLSHFAKLPTTYANNSWKIARRFIYVTLQKVVTKVPTAKSCVADEYISVCEISSSHGGEYDVQSCLLGYTAV
jgi:hypothetical protein